MYKRIVCRGVKCTGVLCTEVFILAEAWMCSLTASLPAVQNTSAEISPCSTIVATFLQGGAVKCERKLSQPILKNMVKKVIW